MPYSVYFKPNSYFGIRIAHLGWRIGKNIVLNITLAGVQRIVVRVFIVVSDNSNEGRSCRAVRMQMEWIQFMKNAGDNI